MNQSKQSGASASVLLLEALRLHNEGKLIDAKVLYEKIIAIEPTNFDALHLIGVIYKQSGEPLKAIEYIKSSIIINPNISWAYTNLGCAYDDIGNKEESLKNLNYAIQINPNEIDALFNKSLVLNKYGDSSDALLILNNIIEIKPNHEQAYYLIGNINYELNLLEVAIDNYLKSIELNPKNANAYFKLGNIFMIKKDFEKSLNNYNLALKINPNLVEAHSNKGNALKEIGNLREALTHYNNAIKIKSDFPDAYYNRAIIYHEVGDFEKSLEDYSSAIKLNPEEAKYFVNRAVVFQDLKKFDLALIDFYNAYKRNSDFDFIYGSIVHLKRKLCIWKDCGAEYLRLIFVFNSGKNIRAITPFSLLSIIDNSDFHLKASKIWIDSKYRAIETRKLLRNLNKNSKIRIGYYSSDLHNHATSYLIAGLFEEHDKNNFEFYIFSFGDERNDDSKKRIINCFDNFYNVKNKSDLEISELSRSLNIDIAIDLKGFTQNSRPGIFANYCAPVQVSYLGYPGTMGASYIDYIIADATVIPSDSRQFYTEKVVYLPHCYQVNDSKKRIAKRVFSKKEVGLPESGFIFCCFNNNYKITPSTFDSWMRLLKALPNSVIWLYEDNPTASKNLREEAQIRGVNSDRLIFAERLPLEEHLARHCLADLFIDTFPCNAHTTASDALWAGLPVLTLIGESFASRVAASLLTTIGLPELIAKTQAEYEAIAIEIASNPDLMRIIKKKLVVQKSISPLFNTKLFAKTIETAYKKIYDRYQDGLAPDHLYIESTESSKINS